MLEEALGSRDSVLYLLCRWVLNIPADDCVTFEVLQVVEEALEQPQ